MAAQEDCIPAPAPLLHSLLGPLRTGSWLTRRGVLLVCGVLITGAVAVLVSYARDGGIGYDFGVFYAASRIVRTGSYDVLFAPDRLRLTILESIGHWYPGIYPWFYPPTALVVVFPLALAPFGAAYTAALALAAALYVSAVVRIIERREAALGALAFPGVLLAVYHGQVSLLAAALLGWALVLLPRHPAAAGIVLGVLSFKPQLGILVPVALAAARAWRTTVWAIVVVAMMAALSYGLFGPEPWMGFLRSLPRTREIMEVAVSLKPGAQSPFSAVRLLGGSIALAYCVQGLTTAVAAVAVAGTWWRPAPHAVKAAALASGTLLATPFLWDYDLVVLGVAIAFVVADAEHRGWGEWERTGLVCAALAPLVVRTFATATHFALGPLASAGVLAIAVRRARPASCARYLGTVA